MNILYFTKVVEYTQNLSTSSPRPRGTNSTDTTQTHIIMSNNIIRKTVSDTRYERERQRETETDRQTEKKREGIRDLLVRCKNETKQQQTTSPKLPIV